MTVEVERLNAQCNELAMQTLLRRTYVPIEDDAQVIDKFRKFNRAIKNWVLDALELQLNKAEVKIFTFPLTTRQHGHSVTTDDVLLFLACVWELLFKWIFGWPQGSQKVPDLWTHKADMFTFECFRGEIWRPSE